MESGKERSEDKRHSSDNTTATKESNLKSPRSDRSNWNVMSVRGKLSDRCLWSACKAMTAGILFIAVGAGMATLGFYSDQLSTVEKTEGNITIWVKNESKDTHLGSLTYLGPVVMGIGGFTIVAACVMTFEARDTAAKIVPVWFRRTRIHVVSGGSGSTPSGRSSKASWDRFLNQQRASEDAADTRTAITQALVNFNKYLQNNVDTSKLLQRRPGLLDQQALGIRKCPSEPNLGKLQSDANGNNVPESMALLEASTPQPTQRTTYGGGLKTMTRTSKPQLLSVAPDTYRQAVSMDCPRSNRFQRQEAKENEADEMSTNVSLLTTEKPLKQALPLQTSCATSSSGSMSVDIYLPQGAVTLKIHDDMKDIKRSPLKPEDSEDSRDAKFSQRSDLQSLGDEDEVLSTDLDDSVFTNQEISVNTPQIVFDASDPKESLTRPSDSTAVSLPMNNISENLLVEDWVKYPQFPRNENISDSLEVHTPEGSPQSFSTSTQFSFDYTDKDSTGISLTSVISNPASSKIYAQQSISLTDTSFINVSSLNSMGSSQDVFSPLTTCDSPRYFIFNQTESSNPDAQKYASIEEYLNSIKKASKDVNVAERNRKQSHPELLYGHASLNLDDSKRNENWQKDNPRKHNSLESFQAKVPNVESPRKQHVSLEMSDPSQARFPRFQSPKTSPGFMSPTTLSPNLLTLSPRKTRSESMPERRQVPSLKRFPLLRQGALDSFAEEGGSSHRLDRSQTQIYQPDYYKDT